MVSKYSNEHNASVADNTESTQTFLQNLGTRVRRARRLSGMSRQQLANNSQISLRHIAQLEAGKGNISVVLLKRLVSELHIDINLVIGDDDPWNHETKQLLALYKQSTMDQRQQIMELLHQSRQDKAERIALVGLRGAGKTTLGNLAAEKIAVPFVQVTEEIESFERISINDIMQIYGQEGYRSFEKRGLERVVTQHDKGIIAVSGGVVLSTENWRYLLRHFHTIWIKATPENLMERVWKQGDKRLMARDINKLNTLKDIIATREKAYAEAHAMINTSNRNIPESLKDLLHTINEMAWTDNKQEATNTNFTL